MDAKAFFDAIARRYDREYALSGPVSRARLARVTRLISGRKRVLVLGIGTGRELPVLLDAGHEPTGLDASSEMAALCNKRSRTVPIVLGDFWSPLPFPDASFDAAIALHGTLAHPPRQGAFGELARELSRVLTREGAFVAEVPSAEGLSRIAGPTFTVTGPTSFVHRDPTTGASIEGVALAADDWRTAFAPWLDLRVEPLGEVEYLLAGRVAG